MKDRFFVFYSVFVTEIVDSNSFICRLERLGNDMAIKRVMIGGQLVAMDDETGELVVRVNDSSATPIQAMPM